MARRNRTKPEAADVAATSVDRGDAQLLLKLARQPGWYSELPDQIRRLVMSKLLAVLNKADLRTRELVAVAKVMATFEKNDLDRGKVLMRVRIEEAEDSGDE